METTRLSTKGQVILPKALRDAHRWPAGTEFTVEETAGGVLLKPVPLFPPTRLEDVVGFLQWKGKPKSIKEMNESIAKEVRRRHARGRY